MENTKYIVSSSPHIRVGETTQKIMLDVLIALAPAMAAGLWFFGMRAVVITAVAVFFAVATEAVMQRIMGTSITITDLSAAVTGVLIAFNVPVTVPWWIVAIGSIFAIAIVKQCFGGLGHNFINPALAARALLLASWPVDMTNWVSPGVDAVSTATPLALLKGGLQYVQGVPVSAAGETAGQALPNLFSMFVGNIGGCIGETSALALLIGGLYLLYKGVISIRIPAFYIGTVIVLTLLGGRFDLIYSSYHVLAGGLFLGAIFMATDYSTSPMTAKGQVVFAIGCGIITVVIRMFGAYPEGVSYSIMLMNLVTPLIDRYALPRKFGEVKRSA